MFEASGLACKARLNYDIPTHVPRLGTIQLAKIGQCWCALQSAKLGGVERDFHETFFGTHKD